MFGTLTPVVKYLLLANIIVFVLATYVIPVDLVYVLGLRYIHAETFRPYQFLTHIFMHGSFMHLFSNMFALFIFGPLLERFWGSQRFLFFYLLTGLGAGVLYSAVTYYEVNTLENKVGSFLAQPTPQKFDSFILENAEFAYQGLSEFIGQYYDNPNNASLVSQSKQYAGQVLSTKENIPMVGASGAVFGILMAFGLLFPNTELFLLFFPFPIKAKYFVLFYGLYELYSGFGRVPGDNVAHFAHLGGMLFAFILIKIWGKKRDTLY